MMDSSDIAGNGSTTESAAACDPDTIINLIALGEQQFASGQHNAAVTTFQRAIEHAPNCAEAYNNLAVISWEQKQQVRALGYIHQAWEVDPSDPTTVMNYGEMLMAMNQSALAQQLYRAYLERCPDDRQVWEALAHASGDNEVPAIMPVKTATQATHAGNEAIKPSDTTKSEHAALIEFLKQAISHPTVKQRVLRIIEQLQPDHYTHNSIAQYRASENGATSWFDSIAVLNWYAHHFRPATYLEVGVRRGRSMAQVLVESDRTRAFGFDLWVPNYASVPEKGIFVTNPGPEFVLSELSGLGVRNLPRFTSGDSKDTLPAFWAQAAAGTNEIELLYIDGDHSYEGAKRDLVLAFEHLAPGGALVFDDTVNTGSLSHLAGLWDEFKDIHQEFIFIEDKSGAGTSVAFKPPFHRLYELMHSEAQSDSCDSDIKSTDSVIAGAQQARIDPASVVDDVGRVFHWNGGVYRGIAPPARSSILKLLASPALDELTESGLVRTGVASIVTDEYPLVLTHEKIPFRTYCTEWTAVMLHDAARMLCNLSVALARNGYCLKDAHPWNIFFDYTRPVFVDFGSVVPLSDFRASWVSEFYRYFVAPLALFSAGQHNLARQLLILKADDSLEGIDGQDILRPVLEHYHSLLGGAERHGILWLMERIGDLVGSLETRQHQGEWSNYDQRPVTGLEDFAPKQRVAYELLQRLPRSTLLDMGANRGWYTKLACSLGYRVAAYDVDDASVTALYLDARERRMPVHPFILDFCNPTPAHGRIGIGYPPAHERLVCDTSLALALVHHLVFKSHLSFEEIAQGIARFTQRRAIVEFIPGDDQYVNEWMTPAFGWYTLNNFIRAMSNHFPHHSIFESSPAPRCILLFEK